MNALLTGTESFASPVLDELYPAERAGILSVPGVVAALSHARRTSPTLRGKAVLTSFLSHSPALSPAGVSVNLPDVGPDVSARERLELHMSDPACGSCHRGMDGIGFSLEKLDWLGRYREEENGHVIDDSSTFPLAGVEVTIQGRPGSERRWQLRPQSACACRDSGCATRWESRSRAPRSAWSNGWRAISSKEESNR